MLINKSNMFVELHRDSLAHTGTSKSRRLRLSIHIPTMFYYVPHFIRQATIEVEKKWVKKYVNLENFSVKKMHLFKFQIKC